MPPPDHQDEDADGDAAPPPKRSRDDNNNEEESYLVKKYRPDSYYRSIEAFSKYTKSHRMFDASYVRWTEGGETPEKPHV
jgi:NADH dehydrogenase [ubiquinone] 1 alpha subcomplex assembly factor 6